MRTDKYPSIIPILLAVVLALVGCEPLAPPPTPQVIIITPPPSPTFTPQPTDTPLPSPTFTPTPEATATATPFPCEEEGGTMLAFDTFRSAIAGENLRYRVYIPPCYLETQKRYPYVILLHGQATTELQWDRIGAPAALDQGVRLGVLAPMILVMPYTGTIANRDPFPPAQTYENVVLEEIIPTIERDFCTINNRDHRAIGGISRGGFWAYSIGLRHPDKFGALGGHSAVFSQGNAPPATNPLDLALNVSFLEEASPRMYLDNAASDPAGRGLELFSSRLSSRGIPHTYIIHPMGDHSDDYWSLHVTEYLTFYGRNWPRSVADLPDCAAPSP
jgi:enterochelin esterase-like enzyme